MSILKISHLKRFIFLIVLGFFFLDSHYNIRGTNLFIKNVTKIDQNKYYCITQNLVTMETRTSNAASIHILGNFFKIF